MSRDVDNGHSITHPPTDRAAADASSDAAAAAADVDTEASFFMTSSMTSLGGDCRARKLDTFRRTGRRH